MKYHPNDKFPLLRLKTVKGESVSVPSLTHTLHVQFRRYAGCPMCNLHLRLMIQRKDEIEQANIREVVIFHSTEEELAELADDTLPFDIVADPDRELYEAFSVKNSKVALFHPKVVKQCVQSIATGHPVSKMKTHFGLPADFLIRSDGIIQACHYGTHASDSWSVNDVLRLKNT